MGNLTGEILRHWLYSKLETECATLRQAYKVGLSRAVHEGRIDAYVRTLCNVFDDEDVERLRSYVASQTGGSPDEAHR